MSTIKVIVVPEKNEFSHDTSHGNQVYINKSLGVPKLSDYNAKYLVPFWLENEPQGANRIFHITGIETTNEFTIIYLGNSYLLNEVWSRIGQPRRFEYKNLDEFGFDEIQEGFLIPKK